VARVDERRWTMAGLGIAAVAAVALALLLRSVVAIWHDVGSIVTSALLLPLVLAHAPPRWRYRPRWATWSIALTAAVAAAWVLARVRGGYPLGLEPIFPALGVSVAIWIADRVIGARPGAGAGAPAAAKAAP